MAPVISGDVPSLALRLYDGRRPDPPMRDYRVAAIDGKLEVSSGVAVRPEATAWSRVLFDDLKLERAEAVHVQGDREAVLRLIRLYAG